MTHTHVEEEVDLNWVTRLFSYRWQQQGVSKMYPEALEDTSIRPSDGFQHPVKSHIECAA